MFTRQLFSRVNFIQRRGITFRIPPLPLSLRFSKEEMDPDNKSNEFSTATNGGKATPSKGTDKKRPQFELVIPWQVLVGAGAFLYWLYATNMNDSNSPRLITFQQFKDDFLQSGQVDRLVVIDKSLVQVYMKSNSNTPMYYFTIGSVDAFERGLEEAQKVVPEGEGGSRARVGVQYETGVIGPVSALVGYIPSLLTLYIMYIIWRAHSAAMGKAGLGGVSKSGNITTGSGLFGIGKSKAKLYNPAEVETKVRFKDVAGMDEAKEEVIEFVRFLREPVVYERLGAKIPKGAIIAGAPGTGKTLLARAVAGEAGVPFLSVSGSEFVEMFVGVGSSRVRDLFAEAKEMAPCIVFIDEIDAIGKTRGRTGYPGGGNDERESTLNQLLVEMDGFNTDQRVVVLAGTNRLDVLDSALTRPGRFDRVIVVDKPDLKGRKDIFKVHLRPLRLGPINTDILAHKLAFLTPGFAGADIANVCNEAALIAARLDCDSVQEKHFEMAIERVIAGIEKKSRVLSVEEKRIVAYHEAGHAVMGWFLEHADPLLKVSIIPRGSAALGYAQYIPPDQYLFSQQQLLDRMCMTLGGRVAEEQFIGRISTGAKDDLQKVTKLAYGQILRYGMNEKIGPLAYDDSSEDGDQSIFKQKLYSEETARMIDQEARLMISNALERTRALMKEKAELVVKTAERLLVNEVLNRADILELLGPRPFPIKHAYEELFPKK